jgi:hypothetical protein
MDKVLKSCDSEPKYFLPKIFGYFSRFVESLEISVTLGQEYKQTLGYANVNWLPLLRAFERILKNVSLIEVILM